MATASANSGNGRGTLDIGELVVLWPVAVTAKGGTKNIPADLAATLVLRRSPLATAGVAAQSFGGGAIVRWSSPPALTPRRIRASTASAPRPLAVASFDRFEDEASRNESRIRDALSGGRSVPALDASPDRSGAVHRSAITSAPSPPKAPGGPTTRKRIRIKRLELHFPAVLPGRRKALEGELVARAKGGARSVADSIGASGGVALPARVREKLEPAFGQSFGDVRIHVDGHASMAAAAIRAEAFTLGRDIYFGRGFYDPSSAKGLALIGHELTHVVQNRGGASPKLRRSPDGDDIPSSLNLMARIAESNRFVDEMKAAIGVWQQNHATVSYEDPTPITASGQNAWIFFCNAFNGNFNLNPRNKAMTDWVKEWLQRVAAGEYAPVSRPWKDYDPCEKVPERELIYQALAAAEGNLPLALATLATVFHERSWRGAARFIDGLGKYKEEDYYRYVGAYIGIQDFFKRGVGTAFGPLDIRGTQVFGKGDIPHSAAKSFLFDVGRLAGADIRPRSLDVAPHDASEEQALSNERAILSAISSQAALPPLAARPDPGAGLRRKSGGFYDWLAENKKFWDDVGVEGVTKGGVTGYGAAAFASLASAMFDWSYLKRQTEAYVVGFGQGAWDGVKGMATMVRHPIRTAEGIYELVVNWRQVSPLIAQKVRALLQLASSDPERFAKECGELAGQIDIALIGPKAVGGTKEVIGAIKTLRNITPLGKTLFYYSKLEDLALIAPEGAGKVGFIGKAGRAAFATALDPALGGSKTVMGFLARNIFLGGNLDFVVQTGKFLKFLPRVAVEWKPLGAVTEFAGGAFKPILLTQVEHGLLRAAKTISGFQYAAETQQEVTILAQQILSNPVTAKALLQSADMLGAAGYVMVDGVAVKLDDIEKTDWSKVQPDPKRQAELAPHRKRGSSRFADDDPEVARIFHEIVRRYGHDPGVSLDLSTRARLERVLGRDLGEVRLHTGPVARALGRETDAEAITLGRDVYVTSEKLGAPEGLGLLAHEVTHVAQARPETPTASPRSLGAGAGIEAMEDVARSIEARFVASPRVEARFPVLAEPVVREAPLEAPAVAIQAPRTSDTAPAAAPAPAAARAIQRKASGEASALDQKPGFDPVQAVMKSYAVPAGVSQEEFLDICKERVLELLKEELASDAERRETLAIDSSLPLV